jgi:hypothetical protein
LLLITSFKERRKAMDYTKEISEGIDYLTLVVKELTATLKEQLEQIAKILAAE